MSGDKGHHNRFSIGLARTGPNIKQPLFLECVLYIRCRAGPWKKPSGGHTASCSRFTALDRVSHSSAMPAVAVVDLGAVRCAVSVDARQLGVKRQSVYGTNGS